jgi:hypothetical protein
MIAVGGDKRIHGFTKSFETLLKIMSSASPKILCILILISGVVVMASD